MAASRGSSDQIRNIKRKARSDWVWACSKLLNSPSIEIQAQVIRSVQNRRKTLVQAGQGVGKTHTAAKIVLAFMLTGRDRKVVTTAPTWKQVEKLLWYEISKIYRNANEYLAQFEGLSGIGGDLLQTELRLPNGNIAIGLSTQDNNTHTLQGHHAAGGVLVVADEACGLSPAVWEGIDAITTGPHDKLLAIGNPTDPGSEFARRCKINAGNTNVIKISCFDTPNIIEGREVIPGLSTIEWVEDMRATYGESSPVYISRVLGEFPELGENSVFKSSDIKAAFQRWEELQARIKRGEIVEPQRGKRILTGDIARYGDDYNVSYLRHGNVFSQAGRLHHGNGPQVGAWLRDHRMKHQADVIATDLGGVGVSVFDFLEEWLEPVVGVDFGSAATDMGKDHRGEEFKIYENMRAQLYFRFAKLLETQPICLEPSDALYNELMATTYSYTKSGVRKIDSKDEIKKAIGRSPDDADAVVLACADIGEHLLTKDEWGDLARLLA